MQTRERIEHLSLVELIQLNDTEGPVEFLDGEITHLSPNVVGPNVTARALFVALYHFSLDHKLGEAFTEVPYVITDTSDWVKGSLVPDVMYFQKERLASYKAKTPDWREKPFVLVPDLVAEVISPTDLYSKVEQKVLHYLADGVRLVWVINPQQHTVVVHRAGSNQQITLSAENTLDGGEIISGFAISVAMLFE